MVDIVGNWMVHMMVHLRMQDGLDIGLEGVLDG